MLKQKSSETIPFGIHVNFSVAKPNLPSLFLVTYGVWWSSHTIRDTYFTSLNSFRLTFGVSQKKLKIKILLCFPHQGFPIIQHVVLYILCPKQELTYLNTKAECGSCPAPSALYCCSGVASSLLRSLHPSSTPTHTTCWSWSSSAPWTGWSQFPFLFYCSCGFHLLPASSTLWPTDGHLADSFFSAMSILGPPFVWKISLKPSHLSKSCQKPSLFLEQSLSAYL